MSSGASKLGVEDSGKKSPFRPAAQAVRPVLNPPLAAPGDVALPGESAFNEKFNPSSLHVTRSGLSLRELGRALTLGLDPRGVDPRELAVESGLPERSIAAPPADQAASWSNTVDSAVPHFAHLERGAARADGNCFFHSMIHQAGPKIARQMKMKAEDLTPQAIRWHIAEEMIEQFQNVNIPGENRQPVPMLYDDVLGKLLDNKIPVSQQAYSDIVGEHLAHSWPMLTPAQRTHVAEVAKDLSYEEGACDSLPALMAHAFPELCIVAHTATTTPDNESHYTFTAGDAGNARVTTVRLFLDTGRRHYEPVREKQQAGCPPSVRHAGMDARYADGQPITAPASQDGTGLRLSATPRAVPPHSDGDLHPIGLRPPTTRRRAHLKPLLMLNRLFRAFILTPSPLAPLRPALQPPPAPKLSQIPAPNFDLTPRSGGMRVVVTASLAPRRSLPVPTDFAQHKPDAFGSLQVHFTTTPHAAWPPAQRLSAAPPRQPGIVEPPRGIHHLPPAAPLRTSFPGSDRADRRPAPPPRPPGRLEPTPSVYPSSVARHLPLDFKNLPASFFSDTVPLRRRDRSAPPQRPTPPARIPAPPLPGRQYALSLNRDGPLYTKLGTAKDDGDCFFHSMIQVAGADLAAAMGNSDAGDPVTPSQVRQHVGKKLIDAFDVHNQICEAREQAQGQRQEELGKLATEFKEQHGFLDFMQEMPTWENAHERLNPDDEDQVLAAVGRENFDDCMRLTKVQRAHVCNVMKDRSWNHSTGDFIPVLMAHAFPGLKFAALTADTTRKNLESFLYNPAANGEQMAPATCRKELIDGSGKSLGAHWEPVIG